MYGNEKAKYGNIVNMMQLILISRFSSRLCRTFVVRFGSKVVCLASDMLRHLIVVHIGESIYATPVLENFERD